MKLKKHMVQFEVSIEPEFTPIEKALGFENTGTDHSEYIKKVLDNDGQNPWLWCLVKVTAKYKQFEGVDYLGCCAYESEQDFRNGGYFEDMCDQAFDDLKNQISQTLSELDGLEITTNEKINLMVTSFRENP